jgi:hypothetical protein
MLDGGNGCCALTQATVVVTFWIPPQLNTTIDANFNHTLVVFRIIYDISPR